MSVITDYSQVPVVDLNHAAASWQPHGNKIRPVSVFCKWPLLTWSGVGQTYFSIWTNLICNEFWKWSLLMLRSLHLWFVSPLRRQVHQSGNMHLINQWVGGARHIYQWKYICAANIQGGDSYIIGKPTYGICPDLPPPDVTFK